MSNIPATAAPPVADWHNDPDLSEKWKIRFAFFEKYGAPGFWGGSPEMKAAFKQLSSGDRLKVTMNWWAFFCGFVFILFGFVYYAFVLKLWRQTLILLGIWLALIVIAMIFSALGAPRGFGPGFTAAFAALCGTRANVLYYLKRTQGDVGWRL